MIDLAQRIRAMTVPERHVAMFWLGQSGFVFKTAAGKVIFVDAYLSNSVERKFGPTWKRILPSLMEPAEVECDYYFSTHEHDDHLDVDAIPVIARNPRVKFAGTPACLDFFQAQGLARDRLIELRPGTALELGGVIVNVVYADHGELAMDAVGLVFDFGGVRIYHTGDTSFQPDRMRPVSLLRPEVILPCINPAFGNLGPKNAASLADFVGARVAFPTHYWMFLEHGGDPAEFIRACDEFAPRLEVHLATAGEPVLLPDWNG